MIKINLAKKKKKKKELDLGGVKLSELGLKSLVISFLIYNFLPGTLEDILNSNEKKYSAKVVVLKKELKILNDEVQKNRYLKDDLNAYEEKIEQLKKRSSYIDKIIKVRTNPNYLLESLARNTPESLWYESLSISEDKKIRITGGSDDFVVIGKFLDLSNNSIYFDGSLKIDDSTTSVDEKTKNRTERFEIVGNISVFNPNTSEEL